MLKLSENPPGRYPGDVPLAAVPGRWWVAHTKPRCEKALAWDLYRRRIPYFLPLVRRVTVSGSRRVESLPPLFPSYLFACGDDHARVAALATNRICQVIQTPEQERLVRELSALERGLAAAGGELSVLGAHVVGRACRVTGGPLAGLEGVAVRAADAKTRLVLRVQVLGQAAAIEVDPGLLEPTGVESAAGPPVLRAG